MNAKVGSSDRPLRVAIVGAGPAGFYAAEALLAAGVEVRIDIIDRLPTPFGLVRYGVAPDHQKVKSVERTYTRILQSPGVRFFGYVELGYHVMIHDLLHWYDQVVVCVGAATDRRLGIPGEDLEGSWSATEFVGYYNGDPGFQERDFGLDRCSRVVVIGVGNVAMDVARVLVRDPAELAPTDITLAAQRALEASAVRRVDVLGRRGPAQAKFSPAEIREIGELKGVDLLAHPDEATLDPASAAWLAAHPDRSAQRNVDYVAERAAAEPTGAARSVVLRFCVSPVEILGEGGRVRGVRVERLQMVESDDGPRPKRTGVFEEIPCDAVFRSVGYRGVALRGLPFDDDAGVIPNDRGRVLDESGAPIAGLYTAGWIKRGPSGLIGTNKACAKETVAAMLEDIEGATGELNESWDWQTDASYSIHAPYSFDTARWERLDQVERQRGEAAGKIREKFTDVDDMIDAVADMGSRRILPS